MDESDEIHNNIMSDKTQEESCKNKQMKCKKNTPAICHFQLNWIKFTDYRCGIVIIKLAASIDVGRACRHIKENVLGSAPLYQL